MGQTTSTVTSNKPIDPLGPPITTYTENKKYYKEIKDTLIQEWENDEYPVWVVIYDGNRRKPRVFFSESDAYSSIYNTSDSFIVKIPTKRPGNPVPSIINKINAALEEFVDILTTADEPPVYVRPHRLPNLTNDPKITTKNLDVISPRSKKPKIQEPSKRDYEFFSNQTFGGVQLRLTIVLDGKLIGIQHAETNEFQWFTDNIDYNEIQYNLLITANDN